MNVSFEKQVKKNPKNPNPLFFLPFHESVCKLTFITKLTMNF